jgi:hypothetical protein
MELSKKMAKDLKVTVNDLIANKENSLNKTGELHHSNRFVNCERHYQRA